MRRSRAVDGWLLATLLPVYVLLQSASIQAHLASGARLLPFSISGAQGENGYPIVWNPSASGLERGDRVLRLANLDLRGLSRAEIRYRAAPLLNEGRPFEVDLERRGTRSVQLVAPEPNPRWWWTIPLWLSFALTGCFLLLRAPHWHVSRRFFGAFIALAAYGACLAPVHPALVLIGYVGGNAVALVLFLRGIFEFTEPRTPGPWLSGLAWAVGAGVAASNATLSVLCLPLADWPQLLNLTVVLAYVALASAGLVRVYRGSEPLGRRQIRWIVVGSIVGMLPRIVFLALRGLVPMSDQWNDLSLLPLCFIPLGVAIAVAGYHWLDIDRVISASSAATVVGVALAGGLLALVPPVAQAASAALGIDPETGRLALSMALAAVLVPAYRALRPWLDRRMFTERHVLAERFEQLRSELAGSRGAEDLVTRAGEGLDALLHPDSIATYARAGEAFTPLFVRGRAAPPAFEVGSTLVQVLEAKGAPLFTRAKQISPFERAALETLGAEVVVPVRRGEQLLAFTCLAGKRSGDIYTASDLALLASVAERCAEVIARIDAETLAREAQAMQSALRRYVPGAVAERVLAGDALEPAEREVSVLFVDIRDYTRTTAGLRPADVFATLNEHTERVSAIVQECGGTIVEFNGDGLMAVFGAPEALAKKEQRAVEAARRIVDSMPSGLAVGVGVATGPAFVGSIRSTDRLIWSAVGATTNLASRLQSLTRELGASIALDEATREGAGYVCVDFARHEGLAIRGRSERLDVFALALGQATRAAAAT